MTRQDRIESDYRVATAQLFERLRFFYSDCTVIINEHSPSVAVSYITEAIDTLAPFVDNREKARKALNDDTTRRMISRGEADRV